MIAMVQMHMARSMYRKLMLIGLFYTGILTQSILTTPTSQQQTTQNNSNTTINSQYSGSFNCTYPLVIDCPPKQQQQYCPSATTVILAANTFFNCSSSPSLSISAEIVIIQGGNLNGAINIVGDSVQIGGSAGLNIQGNFTLLYNTSVIMTQNINITNIISILPQKYAPLFPTTITFESLNLTTRKLLIQSSLIIINSSQIVTGPNICLQQIINIVQFMKLSENGIISYYQDLLTQPINLLIYGEKNVDIIDSSVYTTIIGIYGNYTNFTNTIINTTASACLTNLGSGKGLEAQMTDRAFCSSGGSSSGYGTLSSEHCAKVLSYFMFLSHSFPYLSKGPYISTGSGGYGYREGLENQGAGGGIIFIFSSTQVYTYNTQFLVEGGQVSGDYFVSAGSGGTLFLYTINLVGSNTTFSAAGGASYNNNGSGAGGIVKISFLNSEFVVVESMWVNVSSGYQPQQSSMILQNNGIFYGKFCPPGQWAYYLTCHDCQYGQYSLLGDSSCQQCPQADGYVLNTSQTQIYNISQCFSTRNQNFVKIWIQPSLINWIFIATYIGALILTVIVGVLIKKYYRKKLSVMQTQSFSLQDAKKDLQQTRILTQRLKMQRNIKFEDLMYHIHRITLFGSNNPQCPWALPQFPPQQIKKYILRQGFIDFSVKFNKVAKWTKFQKIMISFSLFLYPWHWFYYDKIKKKKYKKLLQLVQESKQFNLINNYDFQDKNMVTIKISKNTDYTICYLDFMVYDRADTKFFSLTSPFIISISGQGNFLRPFYLQDRDVFFNSLFYIVNKAKQKIEEQQQQDAKKELFTNLFYQKKKQQNRNKLIDFLKNFNTISVTLDLSAPLSKFVSILISLIQYIASWNEAYFRELNVQLDLILMISKVKKGHLVSNQIHILTNRNPQLFKQFMEKNIPKMNRYEKYDLKLGLFVYNPDQEVKKIKNRKHTTNQIKKNWGNTSVIGSEDDQKIQEPLMDNQGQHEQQQQKRSSIFLRIFARFLNLTRYFIMTHRKLSMDKDLMKFIVTVVILFQCLLACVWSVKLQFPYILANLASPFIGILWMVSGSYGIGKLYLMFNGMALLDQIVTLVLIIAFQNNEESHTTQRMAICQAITIFLRLLVIPLATKFLSVSRKLSTSKMFK